MAERCSVTKLSRSDARHAIPRSTRPSCLNAILRCRSLIRRGPSTISTRLVRKIGHGLPAPNGASVASSDTTCSLIERNANEPSIQRRGRRSSGPRRLSAYSLTQARSSRILPLSSVNPAACLWPPNFVISSPHDSSAPSILKDGMLRHDPYATSPSMEMTIAGR